MDGGASRGPVASAVRPYMSGAATLLIAGVLFAKTVQPLYSSNQHTKYLHGFADADVGFLDQDWLAHTLDGLPIFTAIVKFTVTRFGEPAFYFAALFAYLAFAFCAVWIERYRSPRDPFALLLFTALVCAAAVYKPVRQVAFDGLGLQYILGGYFQPSDFGVLLIVSVILFSLERVPSATVSAVVAAALHPGYVVPAACLLLVYGGFEVASARSTSRSSWIGIAAVALGIGALAALAFAIDIRFAPTTKEAYQEAHRILAEFRIPHHSNPWLWNPRHTLYKVIICAAAIACLPGGRLRYVLAALSSLTFIFVLIALLPGLYTYKITAPWRGSVALVPLASLVCLSFVAAKVADWLEERDAFKLPFWGVSASLIVLCVFLSGSAAIRALTPDRPTYVGFVRNHLAAGQIYLTPPSLVSFRLMTGAPQYVTEKSHPYLDQEVLEWYRRLREARSFFAASKPDCEQLHRLAVRENITHILTAPEHVNPACHGAQVIFEDPQTVILHLDISAPP